MLLLPKRNIETWIACLLGEAVDEERDYKPRSSEACREAALRLADIATLPDGAPDSLARGWAELRRVQVA